MFGTVINVRYRRFSRESAATTAQVPGPSYTAVVERMYSPKSSSSSSSSSYSISIASITIRPWVHYAKTLVKIQSANIERRTEIMSFEKLPKVCDVRFCANVLRKSVTRRRTSVRKGALAELGAKSCRVRCGVPQHLLQECRTVCLPPGRC